MPKPKPLYRVRFTLDDHQFEECNGEARPLTEEEYAENAYRACPDHMRAGTQVLDLGGKGKPQIQGCAVCKRTDYVDIPYAEYLAYYGNPDRHVYLFAEVEKQCRCCKSWTDTDANLGGIDLMDDSPEIRANRTDEWIEGDEIAKLPGYLREVAEELIAEL